jgi:hypothetical protein
MVPVLLPCRLVRPSNPEFAGRHRGDKFDFLHRNEDLNVDDQRSSQIFLEAQSCRPEIPTISS